MAAAGSGARPRLVCRRTPVPLMTGWMRPARRAVQGRADPGEHGVERGDVARVFSARRAASSRRTTAAADGRGNVQRAERLEQFFHGGNRAERGWGVMRVEQVGLALRA